MRLAVLVVVLSVSAASGATLVPSHAVGGTHNCAAYYPSISSGLDESGDVLVQYDVDAGGAISNVQLLKTSGFPRLDQAALACVANVWRNTPAMKDGIPIASPALEALVRFVEPEPLSAEGFFQRGVNRSARGDQDGALGDLNTAITMKPDVAAFYVFRAGVYESLHKRTAANADFAKAKALGFDSRNFVIPP